MALLCLTSSSPSSSSSRFFPPLCRAPESSRRETYSPSSSFSAPSTHRMSVRNLPPSRHRPSGVVAAVSFVCFCCLLVFHGGEAVAVGHSRQAHRIMRTEVESSSKAKTQTQMQSQMQTNTQRKTKIKAKHQHQHQHQHQQRQQQHHPEEMSEDFDDAEIDEGSLAEDLELNDVEQQNEEDVLVTDADAASAQQTRRFYGNSKVEQKVEDAEAELASDDEAIEAAVFDDSVNDVVSDEEAEEEFLDADNLEDDSLPPMREPSRPADLAQGGPPRLQAPKRPGGKPPPGKPKVGFSRSVGLWSTKVNGSHGWEPATSMCGTFGEIVGGWTEERNRTTTPTLLERKYLTPGGVDARLYFRVVPLGHWQGAHLEVKLNGRTCYRKKFRGRQLCDWGGLAWQTMSFPVMCETNVEFGVLDVQVFANDTTGNFSEPFGIFNITLMTWQVPCEESYCSTGTLLKEPPPLCEGPCTTAVCCDSGPMCSPDICPVGYLYKLQPVTHCQSGGCSLDDCCDRRATCTSGVCSPLKGFISKLDPPNYCTAATCNTTECCDPLPQCNAEVCRGVHGKILTANPPKFCNTVRCTLQECCETLPQCGVLDCDANRGKTLKKYTPTHCHGRICSEDECCDPLGTCHADVCPSNGVLVNKTQRPVFCQDTKCHPLECCIPLPTCKKSDCGDNSLKSKLPAHCAKLNCTQTECCDLDGKSGATSLHAPVLTALLMTLASLHSLLVS
mmetsp:Transcript_9364/g.20302  ORF Transcript_9364/g.20302 Transcript_9364/m.20302 type:complete len:729 (+) Transcript_9364:120-2306(+)